MVTTVNTLDYTPEYLVYFSEGDQGGLTAYEVWVYGQPLPPKAVPMYVYSLDGDARGGHHRHRCEEIAMNYGFSHKTEQLSTATTS